jgi:nucleotide-binding universal stress UspA family protein
MNTRATTNPGDGSVTDKVLEAATLPIFAMHDAAHDHRTPRFTSTERQPLLVPTDLTPASQPVVEVAFDLARRFAFDVHLLHVLPHGAATGEAAAHAHRLMAALAPPDLPTPLAEHIETGVPARAIAYAAQQIDAACIVMGEHARTPMRHWFRPDTAQGVLHPAPCPIWYVPQPAATAAARLKFAKETQATNTAALQATGSSAAARRLVDELQDPFFRYNRSYYLYGVVDSTEAAESALVELLAAGVKKDQLHTWHGPEGAAAIDPSGEKHGRMARLWRALEGVTGERELLEQYSHELETGHVRIGVQCRSGSKRQQFTEILQRHGGHLISYFSVGSVERVSP